MAKIIPIHYRKLAKIFELEEFKLKRSRGSHLVYTKSGISKPIIIPKYREIPVFIIRNNLRTAGITRERYFELLKKVE